MTVTLKPGRIIMGRVPHGEDLLEYLGQKCVSFGIEHGEVRAIGALSKARYGYYHQDKREYQYIQEDRHLEILSLIGNVSLNGYQPMVHAHLMLGDSEGKAVGGHLAQGCVVFACEFVVQEYVPNKPLLRAPDDQTGLMLWSKP